MELPGLPENMDELGHDRLRLGSVVGQAELFTRNSKDGVPVLADAYRFHLLTG
jgi:hypothetical protein